MIEVDVSECKKCSCFQSVDDFSPTDQILEAFVCAECGELFTMDDNQLKEFIDSQSPMEVDNH